MSSDRASPPLAIIEAVVFLSTKIATGVTKMATPVAPAVLTNEGKDVHLQALTPKEVRNVTSKPEVCWTVSSDFGGMKNKFKANKLSCIQDGEL